jgi:hypothetical protein
LDSIIDKIKSKFSWEPVTEYGIKRWRTTNNLRLQINQPEFFTKSFLGDYENMMPHNNNPIDAFNNCCQQTCPLIYNGKIFKCSTQGLLKDTLEQVGNPNLKQWQSYLHEGISPDCTDTDLDIFLNNFGKPHSMCQMCPTANNAQSKIIHLENVSTKKVKI